MVEHEAVSAGPSCPLFPAYAETDRQKSGQMLRSHLAMESALFSAKAKTKKTEGKGNEVPLVLFYTYNAESAPVCSVNPCVSPLSEFEEGVHCMVASCEGHYGLQRVSILFWIFFFT